MTHHEHTSFSVEDAQNKLNIIDIGIIAQDVEGDFEVRKSRYWEIEARYLALKAIRLISLSLKR